MNACNEAHARLAVALAQRDEAKTHLQDFEAEMRWLEAQFQNAKWAVARRGLRMMLVEAWKRRVGHLMGLWRRSARSDTERRLRNACMQKLYACMLRAAGQQLKQILTRMVRGETGLRINEWRNAMKNAMVEDEHSRPGFGLGLELWAILRLWVIRVRVRVRVRAEGYRLRDRIRDDQGQARHALVGATTGTLTATITLATVQWCRPLEASTVLCRGCRARERQPDPSTGATA